MKDAWMGNGIIAAQSARNAFFARTGIISGI
jgi:hypothetical protein